MPKEIIPLHDSILVSEGSIFWNDNRRRLDLKKPVRDIIEPILRKDRKVYYVMEICLRKEVLANRIKELEAQGIFPILLYFECEKNE